MGKYYKVGEIFSYQGKSIVVEVSENGGCKQGNKYCSLYDSEIDCDKVAICMSCDRRDNQSVVFIENNPELLQP